MVMERKTAAEELSQTNEILQSILSNMGDAVIVADTEGKFLLFNPMAKRMFGMGACANASSEWPDRYGLYLPDKVTPFPHDQLPLTRSIRGEEVNNVEMFVRHAKAPNGLWTRVNGRPLRGLNGELLGGRDCLPRHHPKQRGRIFSSRTKPGLGDDRGRRSAWRMF